MRGRKDTLRALIVGLLLAGCATNQAGAAGSAPSSSVPPPATAVAPVTTSDQAPAATTGPAEGLRDGDDEVDCSIQSCIALTFDDGPAPTTPRLLDVLRSKDVRATFFMLGLHVSEHPDIARRVKAEGHEVGDHTWSHRDLLALSVPEAREEIRRGADAIAKVTGEAPTLFRPPKGRITDEVRSGLDMAEVLWSVDTEDWLTRDPEAIALQVAAGARPGAILLLHDIYATTVNVLPRIIDHLRDEGYTLLTVTQLIGQPPTAGEVYREVAQH